MRARNSSSSARGPSSRASSTSPDSSARTTSRVSPSSIVETVKRTATPSPRKARKNDRPTAMARRVLVDRSDGTIGYAPIR